MEKVVVQGLGFVGSAMAVAISSKVDDNDSHLFKVVGIDVNSDEAIKK